MHPRVIVAGWIAADHVATSAIELSATSACEVHDDLLLNDLPARKLDERLEMGMRLLPILSRVASIVKSANPSRYASMCSTNRC